MDRRPPFNRKPLIDLEQIERGKDILKLLEQIEEPSESTCGGKRVVTSEDISVVEVDKERVQLKISSRRIKDIYDYVTDTILKMEDFVFFDDEESVNLLSSADIIEDINIRLQKLESLFKENGEIKELQNQDEILIGEVKFIKDEISRIRDILYKTSLNFLATIENYELLCNMIPAVKSENVPLNILRIYLYCLVLDLINIYDLPVHVKQAIAKIGELPEIELPDISDISLVDLRNMVTKTELAHAMSTKADIEHEHSKYLTKHQDISHLATREEIPSIEGLATEEYVINTVDSIEIPSIEGLATIEYVDTNLSSKAGVEEIQQALDSKADINHIHSYDELEGLPDISAIDTVASKDYVQEQIAAIEFPVTDVSHLATKEELAGHTHSHDELENVPEIPSIEGLATEEYVNQKLEEYKCPCIDDGEDEEEPTDILVLEYTVARNTKQKALTNYLPEGIEYRNIEIEDLEGIIHNNPDVINLSDTKSVKLYYTPVSSGIRFENTYVEDIIQLDPYYLTDTVGMFENCTYLNSLDLSNWDTREITDMYFMFNGCSDLKTLNLTGWDVSRVSDLRYMFAGCSSLTELNISDWNVELVTTMAHMFNGCSSLVELDVSRWDVSNLEDMSYMFYECASLTNLDLANWNVVNLENMEYAFSHCYSVQNLDLSHWGANNIITMKAAFEECYSLPYMNLSLLDTSNVTDMSGMFYECPALNTVSLNSWNTENVLDMGSMFYGCSSLEQLNLSNWETEKVRDMSYMFTKCSNLKNVNFSNWDTTAVLTSSGMFLDVSIDEWNYNGENYKKWNLTENKTGFNSVFPWNA